MIRRLMLLLTIWLLSGFFLMQNQANAHGLGEQQLERVASGPFLISAWTDPVPATTADELHVTVAVEDEEGLVLESDVVVIASHNDVRVEDTATHEKAVNKLQYEARFNLEDSGTWRFDIAVTDGDRVGEASFDLAVEAVDDDVLPFSIGWIVAGGILLITLGFAVLNRRSLATEKKDVS